ncbi:MAG: hypothetical protein AAGB34_03040 [Planctomycetota bacterium]
MALIDYVPVLRREEEWATPLKVKLSAGAARVPWETWIDGGRTRIALRGATGEMMGFRLHPLSLEESAGAVLDGHDALSRLLEDLGDGMTVHLECARLVRPSERRPIGSDVSPTSWAIEGVRERFAGLDEGLTLEHAVYVAAHDSDAGDRLQFFGSRLGSELEAAGVGLEALSDGVFAGRLRGIACHGSSANVNVPGGMFLDQALGPVELSRQGSAISVDGQWVVPVTVIAPPDVLELGLVDELARFRFGYRWLTRLLPLGAQEAASKVRRQESWHVWSGISMRLILASVLRGNQEEERSRSDDGVPEVDREARNRVKERMHEADQALDEIGSGMRYCLMTSAVFVYGETRARAERYADLVVATLGRRGIRCAIEGNGLLSAWAGALPGERAAHLRKLLVSVRSGLGLVARSAVEHGSAECPYEGFPGAPSFVRAKTAFGEVYDVNLFGGRLDDVGMTALFGPTGGGKSVAMNTLLHGGLLYPRSRALALDIGYSMMLHCMAERGAFQEPRVGGELALPVVQDLSSKERRGLVSSVVLELLHQQGVTIGARERNVVELAVEDMVSVAPDLRRLDTLMAKLRSRELRRALAPYGRDGVFGGVLNGVAGEETDRARLTVVELSKVLELGEAIGTPVVAHLFGAMTRMCNGRDLRVFCVDELHEALERSYFVAGLRKRLLKLRKNRGMLVMAAHTPQQVLASNLGEIVLSSVPTRIFIPDAGILSEDGSLEAYRRFGLTDREIDALGEMEPKREYLLSTTEGSHRISFCLTDSELAIYGVAGSDIADRAPIYVREHGAGWLRQWLRDQGVAEDEVEFFMSRFQECRR